MRLHRVWDLPQSEIANGSYDLAIAASGYEQRARYFASITSPGGFDRRVVLGFTELESSSERVINDQLFAEKWEGPEQIRASVDDDQVVFNLLDSSSIITQSSSRILIDYSSMSRLWYAELLNWLRLLDGPKSVIVDFVYSMGEYNEPYPNRVIKDIIAVPGCEAPAALLSRSVAIFGLGFDGLSPLCVVDRLEPDIVHAFIATSGLSEGYVEKAKVANEELIANYTEDKLVFELPLTSVEHSYRLLTEIVAPYRNKADVTIIPMGPKPHVLASILLCMRLRDVGCLRVSVSHDGPEMIRAAGGLIVTRVEFQETDSRGVGDVSQLEC